MARPKGLNEKSSDEEILTAMVGCDLAKDNEGAKTLIAKVKGPFDKAIEEVRKENPEFPLYPSDFGNLYRRLITVVITHKREQNGTSDTVRQALRLPHLPETVSVTLDGKPVAVNPRMLAEAMRLAKPAGSLAGLVPFDNGGTIGQAHWSAFKVDAAAMRELEKKNAPAPEPKAEEKKAETKEPAKADKKKNGK